MNWLIWLALSSLVHATPPPDTHGARVAARCGQDLAGFGTERKFRRALGEILPRRRMRVERIEERSRDQDEFAHVDQMEFTLEQRGYFGVSSCYRVKLFEGRLERLNMELYNPKRLAVLFNLDSAIIFCESTKGPDMITLEYGPDGHLTAVELNRMAQMSFSSWPRSTFRVLEIPEWQP